MTRRIVLTQAAQDDLARLEDFLIDKSPDAALRATEVISAGVLSLAEFFPAVAGLADRQTFVNSSCGSATEPMLSNTGATRTGSSSPASSTPSNNARPSDDPLA